MLRTKKGYRKSIFVLLCCWMGLGVGFAQNYSLQMYNFNNVGESVLFNPATRIQSNVTVGFYGGLSVFAPGLNLSDIFKKGQTFNDAVHGFLDNDKKSLHNMSFSLHGGFFAGFRIREKNYISLGAYVDGQLRATIPKDLLNLVANGTAPYLGRTMNLAPYADGYLNAVYHIGYAREINKALTIGGRVKLLSGMQNISVTNRQLSFTATDDPSALAKYRYDVNANFSVALNNYDWILGGGKMDVSKFMFQNGINGFALDFGFSYKFNKKWAISASLVDVGALFWNENAFRLSKTGTSINTTGVQIPSLPELSKKNFNRRVDSLVKLIYPDTTRNAYTYTVLPKFYLGTEYSIRPYTKVGATFFGYIDHQNTFDYSFGIWGSHKFWSIVDLRVGWNMFKLDFANLAVGMSINLGYFQVYAMTDNILPVFQYDQASRINVQVGVNFNFGLNLDKDRDGTPNKKDKCVITPGPEEFEGCPDSDRDGVPDYKDSCVLDSGVVSNHGCPLLLDRDGDSVLDVNDSCPDIKGLKTKFGCPDTDEDGIIDPKDSCINEKGPVSANGCPDRDDDGVADKQDSCRLLAGTAEFFGCPTKEALIAARYDKDGDLTPDSIDRCPDLEGEQLLNGCPDYDKDGVPDDKDACMEIPGELKFNGCPDTDNDGVPDYLDECITLSGSVENKGCPVSIGTISTKQSSTRRSKGKKSIADGMPDVIRNITLSTSQSKVLTDAFKFLQFRFQSSGILESSYVVLDELARLLQSMPDAKLILIGYTDDVGDDLFNQTLSYQRASRVKEYLVGKGVTNLIELYGFGENNPVAPNTTAAGRAKNRRVEMAILQK